MSSHILNVVPAKAGTHIHRTAMWKVSATREAA
jgi:hypothetical protein